MQRMRKGIFVLSVTALLCLAGTSSRTGTKAEIDKRMTGDCSNWGRWGKTDQIGAVNLITDAKRRNAAGLVREGAPVSLAHNPITEKAPDNNLPFRHTMLSTGQHPSGPFVMDEYAVSYHGLAHTHMDTLCHMAWNGKMYNGFPQTDVTDGGAKELAITNYKNGIFTRGVLFDIPRLKGKQWLEPGEAIYPEDLDAWLKKTGVKLEAGDVVFIRTGRWARRAAKGAGDTSRVAGL